MNPIAKFRSLKPVTKTIIVNTAVQVGVIAAGVVLVKFAESKLKDYNDNNPE